MKKNETKWARDSAVLIHDETAGWFAGQYNEKKDKFYSAFSCGRCYINRHLFEELSKLPRGIKILDVGCGTGDHLKQLIDLGFDVVGIDPSVRMLKYAESDLPKGMITNGSVLNIPFENNLFDFVYSVEVFRYLSKEDNMRGLAEIKRVLKPDGVFFGTFINLYALNGFPLLVVLRKIRKSLFNKPLRFHSEFETPKSIEKKLLSAGFKSPQMRGAMFGPLIIIYKINRYLGKLFAKLLEPLDPFLSDAFISRPFANHLIAVTKK